eukprot:750689-Hanusia_phi.AAC.2
MRLPHSRSSLFHLQLLLLQNVACILVGLLDQQLVRVRGGLLGPPADTCPSTAGYEQPPCPFAISPPPSSEGTAPPASSSPRTADGCWPVLTWRARESKVESARRLAMAWWIVMDLSEDSNELLHETKSEKRQRRDRNKGNEREERGCCNLQEERQGDRPGRREGKSKNARMRLGRGGGGSGSN